MHRLICGVSARRRASEYDAGFAAMKISYFINQYPKVSHSFIRREILALEALGFELQRIALRGWNEVLPDPADQLEKSKTSYVLRRGLLSLIPAGAASLFATPMRLLRTLVLAIRVSRETDHRVIYHLICVFEACTALRWVRRHGSKHVHAHFGTNSAEVVMYMRLLGGPPYSFTTHGPTEFMSPLALAEKVRHASFAVAISSFGKSQMYMRTAYVDWPKIHVVRCGIDRNFYKNPPSSRNPTRRFVCIGRLSEAKGQLLLLEATAKLVARGVDVELTIAGDGPMRGVLEEQIARHELGRRVRITGWISSNQVREELLASRALILPSFAEGLPVVIMESMSLRRPVLTTYIAGIPELVEHKVNGWLFPAGSSDHLEAAMEDCLACSAEDMQVMGDAGFAMIARHHSVETEAARLADLFLASDKCASVS
jgi:colanic acid/amylovoran biosynthesis glycosyltransferase